MADLASDVLKRAARWAMDRFALPMPGMWRAISEQADDIARVRRCMIVRGS